MRAAVVSGDVVAMIDPSGAVGVWREAIEDVAHLGAGAALSRQEDTKREGSQPLAALMAVLPSNAPGWMVITTQAGKVGAATPPVVTKEATAAAVQAVAAVVTHQATIRINQAQATMATLEGVAVHTVVAVVAAGMKAAMREGTTVLAATAVGTEKGHWPAPALRGRASCHTRFLSFPTHSHLSFISFTIPSSDLFIIFHFILSVYASTCFVFQLFDGERPVRLGCCNSLVCCCFARHFLRYWCS